MHNSQQFPVDVRTGWIDFSPALRHHASERIRSLLAQFALQVRSVTVRISDAEPHRPAHRRCDIEVMTTHAGAITASSIGLDVFALVNHAAESALEALRERASDGPYSELHHKIA
jgi:ribosome-associated translation inhibitor RaiA